MQSKINEKIHTFITKLKESVITYVSEHKEDIDIQKLENFMENYQELNITESDLKKRKRKITVIKSELRCRALKKDSTQCTRSKQKDNDFCGTHINKQPHGIIDAVVCEATTKTINIRKQDISGVLCYIDDIENIYDANDIEKNSKNPQIIGKWKCNEDGSYHYVED